MRIVRVGCALLAGVLAVSCSTLETADERAERLQREAPGSLAFELPIPEPSNALRLALVRPPSWDPIEVSIADQDAVIVSDLLFDGLTEATVDGRLIPALATSWSPSQDFYAWTFVLDTGRTTADDVAISFERLRTEAADSSAVAVIESVVRIDVVNQGTVRFVLSAPNAGFAWLLSGLAYSITDDAGTTSGQFAVLEDEEQRSVLRIGDDENGPSVLIDWVADHETALAAADAGVVDGAVVPLVDSELAARRVGAPVIARSIVRFLGLDPTSAALADIRVRRAVLAGVDATALVDALDTPAFDADGVVAATTAGFLGECGEACTYDPARARALLDEVGGIPVLRIAYTSETEEALVRTVAEQLRAVGFTVDLVFIGPGLLSASLDSSSVDIFPYGWVAPAGSVDAVVPALFDAGSSVNPLGSIAAAVDQTLAAAAVAGDDAERWALLETAHRQVLDSAVVLPIAVAQNRFVVSPAFTGVVPRADGSLEIRSLP